MPPLAPDVCLVPVAKADIYGNGLSLGGRHMEDVIVKASKRVILSAEEIVDNDEFCADPTRTTIPGVLVESVVHAPFGAHPSGCAGLYGPDKIHMREYVLASKDDASFETYLKTYVHGVRNHDEYVERFVPLEWKQPTRAAGA